LNENALAEADKLLEKVTPLAEIPIPAMSEKP